MSIMHECEGKCKGTKVAWPTFWNEHATYCVEVNNCSIGLVWSLISGIFTLHTRSLVHFKEFHSCQLKRVKVSWYIHCHLSPHLGEKPMRNKNFILQSIKTLGLPSRQPHLSSRIKVLSWQHNLTAFVSSWIFFTVLQEANWYRFALVKIRSMR